MPKLKEEKKQVIDRLIRDKVYTEAKLLMEEAGANLFTMAELAERVGVAKGTLYNYFNNKFDVVYYVCERLNDEYMEDVKAYFKEHPGSYEQNLRYVYRASLENIRRSRFAHVATLHFHLNALNDKANPNFEVPIFKAQMIKNRVFFTKFFEDGKKAGVFKDFDPKIMAAFIDTYLLGVNSYCFLREPGLLDTEIARKAFAENEEMLVSAVCKK